MPGIPDIALFFYELFRCAGMTNGGVPGDAASAI